MQNSQIYPESSMDASAKHPPNILRSRRKRGEPGSIRLGYLQATPGLRRPRRTARFRMWRSMMWRFYRLQKQPRKKTRCLQKYVTHLKPTITKKQNEVKKYRATASSFGRNMNHTNRRPRHATRLTPLCIAHFHSSCEQDDRAQN